jgi:hypothetical protein
MDEDEIVGSAAMASWPVGWLGGALAMHWMAGWSWWWAVPLALVPAFIVAFAVMGLGFVVLVLFEGEEGWQFGIWAVGWLGAAAAFHWGLGSSWWWAVPLALVPSFVVALVLCFAIAVVFGGSDYAGAPPPDETDDFEEEDSEPEPPPPEPPRAGGALDARAKKLFAQFDDPAAGQRGNALELLRAHLAKNKRTFRDLLHEFEGRPNG